MEQRPGEKNFRVKFGVTQLIAFSDSLLAAFVAHKPVHSDDAEYKQNFGSIHIKGERARHRLAISAMNVGS